MANQFQLNLGGDKFFVRAGGAGKPAAKSSVSTIAPKPKATATTTRSSASTTTTATATKTATSTATSKPSTTIKPSSAATATKPVAVAAVDHSALFAEVDELRVIVQARDAAINDLHQEMEGVEKERDFYFEKLRQIEIMLQAVEDQGNGSEITGSIMKILYATAEGFEPADEADVAMEMVEETY